MRDYHVHSENTTEIELIIDHVHKSQETNELFHESREYFRSRITGNNFVLSRFTAIKNRHSRFTKKPLSDPQLTRRGIVIQHARASMIRTDPEGAVLRWMDTIQRATVLSETRNMSATSLLENRSLRKYTSCSLLIW